MSQLASPMGSNWGSGMVDDDAPELDLSQSCPASARLDDLASSRGYNGCACSASKRRADVCSRCVELPCHRTIAQEFVTSAGSLAGSLSCAGEPEAPDSTVRQPSPFSLWPLAFSVRRFGECPVFIQPRQKDLR
jgi:hypothetical protein